VNRLVDSALEAGSLQRLGTEENTAICPRARDFSREHSVRRVGKEEDSKGDRTDILVCQPMVSRGICDRWSSLQLCLAYSLNQMVFRNNDG
jgi:hypothetical protein